MKTILLAGLALAGASFHALAPGGPDNDVLALSAPGANPLQDEGAASAVRARIAKVDAQRDQLEAEIHRLEREAELESLQLELDQRRDLRAKRRDLVTQRRALESELDATQERLEQEGDVADHGFEVQLGALQDARDAAEERLDAAREVAERTWDLQTEEMIRAIDGGAMEPPDGRDSDLVEVQRQLEWAKQEADLVAAERKELAGYDEKAEAVTQERVAQRAAHASQARDVLQELQRRIDDLSFQEEELTDDADAVVAIETRRRENETATRRDALEAELAEMERQSDALQEQLEDLSDDDGELVECEEPVEVQVEAPGELSLDELRATIAELQAQVDTLRRDVDLLMRAVGTAPPGSDR